MVSTPRVNVVVVVMVGEIILRASSTSTPPPTPIKSESGFSILSSCSIPGINGNCRPSANPQGPRGDRATTQPRSTSSRSATVRLSPFQPVHCCSSNAVIICLVKHKAHSTEAGAPFIALTKVIVFSNCIIAPLFFKFSAQIQAPRGFRLQFFYDCSSSLSVVSQLKKGSRRHNQRVAPPIHLLKPWGCRA